VIKLRWQISPRWDIAGGYREVTSKLDIQNVKNSFERKGFVVNAGYSF
jgi:hypothetical protein